MQRCAVLGENKTVRPQECEEHNNVSTGHPADESSDVNRGEECN